MIWQRTVLVPHVISMEMETQNIYAHLAVSL